MSELNLIPYELKNKRVNSIKLKNYISFGIIIFAVFFIIIYIPNLYLSKLNSQEALLTFEIASNSQTFSENTKVLAEIKEYDLYVKAVDMLKKQRVSVADKIKNFQKYTPLAVVLTNIDFSKGLFTLNGTSTDYKSISIFAANLQMSKEYPLTRIFNVTHVGLEKYKFTINIFQ